MTSLTQKLTIIRQLQELGVQFWTEINIHQPDQVVVLNFLETFGITGQRWIDSCKLGPGFRSIDVGDHITIFLREQYEPVETEASFESPALRDPVGAIALAAAFFQPENVENVKIRCLVTAEDAIRVMRLFDAPIELNESSSSGKWISYGPVSIFFIEPNGAERVCPAAA